MSSLVRHGQSLVDGLVAMSACDDGLLAARHRVFLSLRLITAGFATALLPLALVFTSPGLRLDIVAVVLVLAPLSLAFFLSRTGWLEASEIAHGLFVGLGLASLGYATGGLSPPVLALAAPMAAEAALSSRHRAIILNLCAVIASLGFSALAADPEPAAIPSGITMLAAVLACAYGLGLMNSEAYLSRFRPGDAAEKEQLYLMLARHMTDLITRHGRSGQVTFASPATRELLGLPPNALHGYGLFDRVHVADRPAYLQAVSDALRLSQETSTEFRLRREDENGNPSFFWLEMRCSPLPVEDGNDAVVSVLRDISERKAQEAALDLARAEAEKANEARTRFLANVSHELRTPLNAIIGFSDMLIQEEALRVTPEKRHEYAGIIHESGGHLLNLVNSILDMSKIESGRFDITPEAFDVGHLIQTCAQIVELPASTAGITLDTRLSSDLPELIADKRACRQILINLLSNAVKFTEAGGRVIITARQQGDHMLLEVADNGVGMSEEEVKRLGEPFFQARTSYNRQYEGTGLGVSVVKGLAELQGGRLTFTSRPGHGTTATVTLPLDVEAKLSNVESLTRALSASPSPDQRKRA